MNTWGQWALLGAVVPVALMLAMAVLAQVAPCGSRRMWRVFQLTCGVSALAVLFSCVLGPAAGWLGWIQPTTFGLWMALLVQTLGGVIGAFSARYLQGESGHRAYITALACVLAAVQTLLLANHWLLLIAAWAAVGLALQHLLCFYADRPFARLAAHKKRLADRVADVLLLAAAGLAWHEVGSGSFTDLTHHLNTLGASPLLQASAVLLSLAVILRTALLPVHGWLIQVMEAPTPVSALLHAGVVNLGGVVLIRFAPLLEQAPAARVLLAVVGLLTAVLAGMVMLTRISIKVRLAWSTLAQMGFMVLECALGLTTLAALHLIGHSLYKAHAFLSASEAVRNTRLNALKPQLKPSVLWLLTAPLWSTGVVFGIQTWLGGASAWPLWWTVVLGLAWAPLLWLPSMQHGWRLLLTQGTSGVCMVLTLSLLATLAHHLPFGLRDQAQHDLGWLALAGMGVLYGFLALLQRVPQRLETWRRWSYAGFYLDEAYTRLTLFVWPTQWTAHTSISHGASHHEHCTSH